MAQLPPVCSEHLESHSRQPENWPEELGLLSLPPGSSWHRAASAPQASSLPLSACSPGPQMRPSATGRRPVTTPTRSGAFSTCCPSFSLELQDAFARPVWNARFPTGLRRRHFFSVRETKAKAIYLLESAKLLLSQPPWPGDPSLTSSGLQLCRTRFPLQSRRFIT